MPVLRSRVGLLLATLLLVAGAAVAPAQEPARHFLWTVRGDGPGVAYLLGSLHVLMPDAYPLPAPIERAFAESGTLVEEIDLGEMEQPATLMAMMGKALFLDGRTLDGVIDAALFARVAAAAEAAGLPRAAIQRAKPWMAAMLLTGPAIARAGFDPAHGVDQHFFERAREAGMPIEALESVAYQLDRFDQMPMPAQAAMLEAVLDDIDTQVSQVKVIADAWRRGDVEALERLLLAAFESSPEMHERLLLERNRAWVPKVEACLARSRPCFVVVGAAHLVGADSLVALLRAKGYAVTQQ